MKMKMKWLVMLNHEVLGSHVKHFLLFFFFTSDFLDPVRSFKIRE